MSDRVGSLAAQDLDYAPYGVGSSAETANAPSGLGSILGSAYNYLGDLAKRSFGASEQMRQGGSYNPAPIVEAAMLPMTGAVAGTGPGGFAVGSGPIKAYHSSPHDFDKFDLAKIGTGEGAQVYGHGLYFAENPAVSGQGGQYWQQFAHRFPERETEMAETLKRFGFDRERAAAEAQKHIDMLQKKFGGSPILGSGGAIDKEIAKRQAEIELYRSDKPIGPRTYEVNIKADPAHMLDWDRPLREQSSRVQKTVRELQDFGAPLGPPETQARALQAAGERAPRFFPSVSGSGVYSEAASRAGKPSASEIFNQAGIPGIKYLDEGSRGQSSPYLVQKMLDEAKAGLATAPKDKIDWHTRNVDLHERMLKDALKPSTSNYVIFDPSIIDIMKKYGIAGAAPAGMGALAAQDRYLEERM